MLRIHSFFSAYYTALYGKQPKGISAIDPAIKEKRLFKSAPAINQKMDVSVDHSVSLRFISSYFKYFGQDS